MQKEKTLNHLIQSVHIKPKPRQSFQFTQSLTKQTRNNLHTSVLQTSIDNISIIKSAQNLFKKNYRKKINIPFNIQNKNPNFIKTIQNHVCQNHQNKQARFKTNLEDDNLYYCQKCAISLASQGFSVLKIDQQSTFIIKDNKGLASQRTSLKKQEGTNKKVEVEFFLDHVQFLKESLQKRTQMVHNHKKYRERQFEDFKKDLEKYFSELQRLLKEEKQIYLDIIQKQREQYLKMNKKQDDQLLQSLANIQLIKVDIQNVIYNASIDQKLYINKITQSKNKLKSFKHLIHQNNCINNMQNIKLFQFKSLDKVSTNIKKIIQNALKGLQHKKLFSFQKPVDDDKNFDYVNIFSAHP